MPWLYWSDHPLLYQTTVWALWLAALALVFLPERGGGRSRPWNVAAGTFVPLLWLFIFAARWPGLFGPMGYNPDEDQLLAAARNLAVDPMFFRSAECGSSGPMNVYPLLLAGLLGAQPSLFSGRVIGLLMVAGSVTGLYLAARAAVSAPVARAAAFAVATLLGSTWFWDFRHYTSEHPPVFLLCVAWAATAWVAFPESLPRPWRTPLAVVAAVALALVPLAKLQATHLALLSGLLLLAAVLGRTQDSWAERWVRLAWTIVAALAVPLAFAGVFYLGGVLDYAWLSYIGNALAYRGEGAGWPARLQLLYGMLAEAGPLRATELSLFVAGNLLFCAAAVVAVLLPSPRTFRRSGLLFAGAGLLLTVLAVYTVTSTMRNYPHYLYFLPIPLVMLSAGLLQGWRDRRLPEPAAPWRTAILWLVFLSATTLPAMEYLRQNPHPHVGMARRWSENPPVSDLSRRILAAAAGGNGYLAVWGYNPKHYTETGLLSATRLSTSSSIFNDNDLQPFFLRTYLEDLQKNQPTVFVDAVAPGQFLLMNDRGTHGHEAVPEIRDWVRRHYQLVEEVDGVRIYRRL